MSPWDVLGWMMVALVGFVVLAIGVALVRGAFKAEPRRRRDRGDIR